LVITASQLLLLAGIERGDSGLLWDNYMIRVQASHIPYGLRGKLGVDCLVNLTNWKKDV
jgi:hypothetical protein